MYVYGVDYLPFNTSTLKTGLKAANAEESSAEPRAC